MHVRARIRVRLSVCACMYANGFLCMHQGKRLRAVVPRDKGLKHKGLAPVPSHVQAHVPLRCSLTPPLSVFQYLYTHSLALSRARAPPPTYVNRAREGTITS